MRGLTQAQQTDGGVEWRTIAVAAGVHGAWLTLVLTHAVLPWPVTVVGLGMVVAWHGSLQHETIHGHPFRSRRLNTLLGVLPLSLHLPYHVYRHYHLLHHECPELTDPTSDPESFYVTARQWQQMGRLRRWFVLAHHTLLGRMVLGPPRSMVMLLMHQTRSIRRGDTTLAKWWTAHAAAASVLVIFVVGVVGMPWWVYVLGAVYLSHSLTLLRSYCEHRWTGDSTTRSAVVRSGWLMGLLYLNNNLHHVHHTAPGVAWYRLPAHAESTDAYAEAASGAGLYHSYLEVARRFLLRPYDHPAHPAQPLPPAQPVHSVQAADQS